MKKKSPNLISSACAKVTGFSELYALMQQRISISGKSKCTLENYTRHLAHIALHFNQLPTELDPDQINDYLYLIMNSCPSLTFM